MISYCDNNYGADADGNRGIKVWEFELEYSDEEEVKSQINKYLLENDYDEDDLPETCKIYIYSPDVDEDIEFEVSLCDYL